MRYHDITTCDVNNGEGFRVTLWVAGCSHHCKGCHNPETWDFLGGRPFDETARAYLLEQLARPYIQGLTLSGGDPLCSPDDVVQLAREIKITMPDKDIWLYTGFTFAQIRGSKTLSAILPYVDVIVDGEYQEDKRDISLAFRGSTNQNIIRMNTKYIEKTK